MKQEVSHHNWLGSTWSYQLQLSAFPKTNLKNHSKRGFDEMTSMFKVPCWLKKQMIGKGLEKSMNQAAMEVLSRKREGKRLYARAQKWSCQTCLFLDSRKPTFELLRNCFSLPSESKNGHACRKNGCPPRVHFQATNVNAISVPSGRIVRRPTRIDTSMPLVDACCTASNNSRKLPVTVQGTLLIEKANDWQKVWRRVWIKLQWKFCREKGRASVCMRVPKSGLARRAYFLDSRKPTFELLRNCFSLPSESKNGHACRKNGCPPRVHFQATNVNAISVPSGRIGRRPTRIDTSMPLVDACCTASNNSRKLPVTVSWFPFGLLSVSSVVQPVFDALFTSSLQQAFVMLWEQLKQPGTGQLHMWVVRSFNFSA